MALQSFDNSNSDEARQFLLDRRCERLHPKRHRTQKRAKGLSKKKRAKIKHQAGVRAASFQRFKTAVRAYWSGETDMHP